MNHCPHCGETAEISLAAATACTACGRAQFGADAYHLSALAPAGLLLALTGVLAATRFFKRRRRMTSLAA